jgi:hypothetical protein
MKKGRPLTALDHLAEERSPLDTRGEVSLGANSRRDLVCTLIKPTARVTGQGGSATAWRG